MIKAIKYGLACAAAAAVVMGAAFAQTATSAIGSLGSVSGDVYIVRGGEVFQAGNNAALQAGDQVIFAEGASANINAPGGCGGPASSNFTIGSGLLCQSNGTLNTTAGVQPSAVNAVATTTGGTAGAAGTAAGAAFGTTTATAAAVIGAGTIVYSATEDDGGTGGNVVVSN